MTNYKGDMQLSENIEKVLNNLVKSLEISRTAQEKAEKRYTSIGDWLNREDSELYKFSPEFYSQGSIRLGTVIKPLTDDEEYDLDAVCLLSNLEVTSCTQETIKKLVGNELQLYVKANNFQKPLNEGKRCWTLEYSDSAQFHMDVLPSVPDEKGFRIALEHHNISMDSIEKLHTSTAIAITDKTMENYSIIHHEWNKSNPKGYYEWFKQRCKVTEIKKSMNSFDSISMESVEAIPSQTHKLPLQKAIMILKRHRDIMFRDDGEHKPISIIITTLSARAYNGTESLKDTLDTVINGIQNEITCDINKNCEVLNPINPSENFADKWIKEPIKKENFFKWLEQLKKDYQLLVDTSFSDNKLLLESKFGNKAIQATYDNSFGILTKLKDKAKQLLSLAHVQKPQWTMSYHQYEVKIICQKSKNGMLIKELKSGEAIEKNWKLRFEAKIENIGSGRKFYWQVANSGDEAKNANSLRGGFYDSDITKGEKIREESTSYQGSHFVRCFVVQNNVCVAVSEPFIVNIV